MKLTYIFHSGFIIDTDKFSILIDYYVDVENESMKKIVSDLLLASPKKLYILSTHSHPDHFNPEILKWNKQKDNIVYIFSKDILDAKLAKSSDAIFLDKLQEYEDENLKIKAFGSTDIGGSFLIQIGDKKLFHAGDLNNWHWNEESTADEIQKAENYFHDELTLLAEFVNHINMVMFPLDPRLGKDFMKGAIQFVETIKTDIFAPMHFDTAYDKIRLFQQTAAQNGCTPIFWSHTGESITF